MGRPKKSERVLASEVVKGDRVRTGSGSVFDVDDVSVDGMAYISAHLPEGYAAELTFSVDAELELIRRAPTDG